MSLSGVVVYPYSNGTSLTSMSETYMSTNGEWEVVSITIFSTVEVYNGLQLPRLAYQVTTQSSSNTTQTHQVNTKLFQYNRLTM